MNLRIACYVIAFAISLAAFAGAYGYSYDGIAAADDAVVVADRATIAAANHPKALAFDASDVRHIPNAISLWKAEGAAFDARKASEKASLFRRS